MRLSTICVLFTAFFIKPDAQKLFEINANEWLQKHNDMRRVKGASDMELMLQAFAEEYAVQCPQFTHREGVGESLLYGPSSTGNPFDVHETFIYWHDDEGPPAHIYETGECNNPYGCGHYRAIVWAETCSVGCAVAQCGSGNNYQVVCNYYPPVWSPTFPPYNQGAACSDCENGCSSDGILCNPSCEGEILPESEATVGEEITVVEEEEEIEVSLSGGESRALSPQLNEPFSNGKAAKERTPVTSSECQDTSGFCNFWVSIGQCLKNPTYMHRFCRKSCGKCGQNGEETPFRTILDIFHHNPREGGLRYTGL